MSLPGSHERIQPVTLRIRSNATHRSLPQKPDSKETFAGISDSEPAQRCRLCSEGIPELNAVHPVKSPVLWIHQL